MSSRIIHSRNGRPVTGPDGTEYCSMGEAARALDCHPSNVRHHWLRYGHLNYLGGGAVPCEYRGKRYASLTALAKKIGVKRHTLTAHLQRHGNFDRAGIGTPRGNPGNPGPRKEISIGPMSWPSRKQAAEDLGIGISSLCRWISPNASPQQRDNLMAAVMRVHGQRRAAA